MLECSVSEQYKTELWRNSHPAVMGLTHSPNLGSCAKLQASLQQGISPSDIPWLQAPCPSSPVLQLVRVWHAAYLVICKHQGTKSFPLQTPPYECITHCRNWPRPRNLAHDIQLERASPCVAPHKDVDTAEYYLSTPCWTLLRPAWLHVVLMPATSWCRRHQTGALGWRATCTCCPMPEALCNV
jgi:hypothetical protein